MSVLAEPLVPAPAVASAESQARAGTRLELPLRLAAFAALCAFCCLHYVVLVAPAPAGRALALTAAVTAGGAALALSARLRLPRLASPVLRIAIALATLALSLLTTGVRARLLLPGAWGSLGGGIHRGVLGLNSFDWPYDQSDGWLRLTILLGMPALAVPASLVAFWPARRGRALRQALALALLLALYGTGVAQRELGGWALRGAGLAVLVAAWLWLPRLRLRRAPAAIATVAACTLLALPLAAGVDGSAPWLDYRDWSLASAVHGPGTTFDWNHGYGPIDWPRDQRVVLEVESRQPHYWKAESLDRFDGLRWVHSDTTIGGDSGADIPQPGNRAWNATLTFHVRGLRSNVFPAAGTPYRVDSTLAANTESDGTIQVLDASLADGDSYSVRSYIPDPTSAQMQAAPRQFDWRLLPYTYFDLPAPRQSALRSEATPPPQAALIGPRTVGAEVPGQGLPAPAARRIAGSPYAGVYRLARTLASGQSTTYGVVRAVQGYLESRRFRYDEQPPLRAYPLASFLLRDRRGYCQQFSGAMALLLRMNGIPTRVAGGFSPGAYDNDLGMWQVRDIDAHSWVEVWFSGIGWVPFDPTPAAAPASSQSSALSTPSASRGAPADVGASHLDQRTTPAPSTVAGDGGGSGRAAWAVVLLAALAAIAIAALWLAAFLARHRRRMAAHDDAALAELRAALDRLGYRYPASTTLAALERRLEVAAGPAAARYAALLGRRRFARGGARPPSAADRRALRRALTSGGGPRARLRGLLVLPPRPRGRVF